MTIFAVRFGMWRSWLAHHVRDVGVGCSSHLIPTKGSHRKRTFFCLREVLYIYPLKGSSIKGFAMIYGIFFEKIFIFQN